MNVAELMAAVTAETERHDHDIAVCNQNLTDEIQRHKTEITRILAAFTGTAPVRQLAQDAGRSIGVIRSIPARNENPT